MPTLATLAVRLLALALPAAACLAGQTTLTRPDTLREHPSGFSGRIMEVQRRSTVEVLEVRQDWLRVMAPGNRSGWILRQNTDLDAQFPTPGQPPAMHTPPATGHSGLQSRGSPRASNHALIIGGDPGNASAATRLASLMGVPDGNIRYLPGPDMSLEALRRAFVDLDARTGDGDRLLIHLTPPPTPAVARRACPDGTTTTDRQLFGNDELLRHLSTLARRSDKLFLVIDAASPGLDTCPPPRLGGSGVLPANVLALVENGRRITPPLLACLEGDAPRPLQAFADGEALQRCVQGTPGTSLHLVGNTTLTPVPRALQAQGGALDSAARLLDVLHAQRDQRAEPDIRQQASPDRNLRFRAYSQVPAYLYVLAATADGIALLHPNRQAPEARLEAGRPTELTLPPLPGGSPGLLFVQTDGPRSMQRAGFIASADSAASGPDNASLYRAVEEFLGGDHSPTCRLSETRNLGAAQARQCATRFSAKWITPASGKAPR